MKLVRKVELILFEDKNSSLWGVTHKETHDPEHYSGFNAFWDSKGLFHDIFEHAHEHTNPYFKGDYAMNLGGEMAAMGAMLYYIDELGLYRRYEYISPLKESLVNQTYYEVQEAISEGSCWYGDTLESNIPKQGRVYSPTLEDAIAMYWDKTRKIQIKPNDHHEYSQRFKDSVTFRKIADLHRYGFRMAERLVPHSYANLATLAEFLSYWGDFTKQNKAEYLARYFEGITFKIYHNKNKEVSWEATFNPIHPNDTEPLTINQDSKQIDMEEWIVESMQEEEIH